MRTSFVHITSVIKQYKSVTANAAVNRHTVRYTSPVSMVLQLWLIATESEIRAILLAKWIAKDFTPFDFNVVS